MLVLLVLVPLLAAAVAWLVPSNRARPWIVAGTGLGELVLALVVLAADPQAAPGDWLALDPLAKLLLAFETVLFCLASAYAPGYLAFRPEKSNRAFCAAMLALLSMMILMILSHHLGLMWVALEAATLSTAPMIYFNRSPRSLEAAWKYLLIGSVGIALALLGSFFLAYAAHLGAEGSTLLFDDLVRNAPELSKPWLRTAFVILFVGYGTKMGLAPMHTWKPDVYGEAPGLVGALLAGGLTSCAFMAILRFYRICHAAGEGDFAREILLFMGLLSMAVAGVFMARQRDFKRLLAYSSVEHMGILAVGAGLGRVGLFGALLHLVMNGLTKGVLFLSAGNVHRAYGSKSTGEVRGALRHLPLSGTLLLLGFFAITGSPPFGPFLSEFTILGAAMGDERFGVAALFLLILAVVFVGMGAAILSVVQGEAPERPPDTGFRDGFLTGAPIVVLMALVLLLGVYVPPPVHDLVEDAARFLELSP